MSRSPSNPALNSATAPQHRSLPKFQCSSITVPFPAMSIKPFVPFHLVMRDGPFEPKKMWKAAVAGVKAIKMLSRGVAPSVIPGNIVAAAENKFTVVSGHHLGHLLVWDVDRSELLGSCQHFNNATVAQLVVTGNFIYTTVEKENVAKALNGNDTEVHVWCAKTLELLEKLSAHEERVTCIAVDDTKETRLASGGADHMLFLWDHSLRMKSAVGMMDSVNSASGSSHHMGGSHLDGSQLAGPWFRKFVGHKSTVTKIAITRTSLISGGGDGEIRHWNTTTGECLQVLEGHQGQLTVMEWSIRPNAADHFHGKLVTGCNGGLVRGWDYIPQRTPNPNDDDSDEEDEEKKKKYLPRLEQYAFNKAHKSSVVDIVCDNDVMISCSSVDGITFFNTAQRNNNFKITSLDTGVRCMSVDPERQLLVAGTDKGQLMFFDYSNFVNQTKFHEDPVSTIATLHPHVGAITGMLLERGASGEWNRLLTISTDSSIFKIDFEPRRDAKLLGTMSANQISRTEFQNILIPLQHTTNQGSGSANLYSDTLIPLSGPRKRVEGKQGTRVVALRYLPELARVVAATDDGLVHFFSSREFVDEDTHVSEEILENTNGSLNFSPNIVRDLSEPANPRFVAVSLQKSANSRTGLFGVLDVLDETMTMELITLNVPIFSVKILSFPVPPPPEDHYHGKSKEPAPPPVPAIEAAYHLAVVVQLRNGEVQLYSGQSDSRVLILLRQLVRDQVGSASQLLESSFNDMASLQWPVPCRVVATLNTKYEPHRVNVLYAEGMRTLRQIETPLSRENNTQTMFSAVYNFDILSILPINQGLMTYALVVEHSTSFITGSKGEAMFEIHYDGSVSDCTMLTDATGNVKFSTYKRHRSLLVEENGSSSFYREPPHCCSCSFSRELRFVAFGYRDGLIQLWDANSHRIFKRITAHTAPVIQMWCFGEQRLLMSMASSGFLRSDTVWPKTLRDAKNNTSPTPGNTPAAQSLRPPSVMGGAGQFELK